MWCSSEALAKIQAMEWNARSHPVSRLSLAFFSFFSVAVNHVLRRSICSPVEQLMHLPLLLLSMTAADKPAWSVYYRLSEMRALGRRASQLFTSTWQNQLSVSNLHLGCRYIAINKAILLNMFEVNTGASVCFVFSYTSMLNPWLNSKSYTESYWHVSACLFPPLNTVLSPPQTIKMLISPRLERRRVIFFPQLILLR